MLREYLRKARHNGDLAQGQEATCDQYLAEELTMSEDVGYMSDNLDWSCQSGSSSTGRTRASNWMGLTSMIVGTLALGAALFAAFAPRDVVERTGDRVRRALRRAALKRRAENVRSKAERVMEGVSTAVSSHSPGAGSPTGVGMSGMPSHSHSH
ncbi:MAG: hypothetical protein ACYC63_08220 [Armatimonadota bacterium]